MHIDHFILADNDLVSNLDMEYTWVWITFYHKPIYEAGMSQKFPSPDVGMQTMRPYKTDVVMFFVNAIVNRSTSSSQNTPYIMNTYIHQVLF